MADRNTNKNISSSGAGTSSRSSAKKNTGKMKTQASGSKKSGSRSASSAGKRSSRGRNTARSSYQYYEPSSGNSALNTEIFCITLLAVSILIFISLLGIGGKVGNALGDIFFGLMGTNAYVFPFLLFFLTIFVMVNRGNRRAYIQTAALAGLFVIVCGLMELMLVGWRGSTDIVEYYEVGSQYHEGGGIIGGALEMFFCQSIGVAGAYIFLILAAVLMIALFTQKALFVSAGKKSREAFAEKREISRVRHEENKARREQEKELRRAEMARQREEEDKARDARLQKLREDQKKRFGESSKLPELSSQKSADANVPAASSSSGRMEDPDGIAFGFFRKPAGKKDSGLSVSTDLFGETKPSSGLLRRKGKPASVVFGKLEGDVPDEENAPVTTFDKDFQKSKVVSSGSLRKKSTDPNISGSSADESSAYGSFERKTVSSRRMDAEASEDPEKSQIREASLLSPDFEIHRGGSTVSSGSSGSGGGSAFPKGPKEAGGVSVMADASAPSGNENPETDDDEADAFGGIVTKKQIEEAGVSNQRKKAAEQKAAAGSTNAGSRNSSAGSAGAENGRLSAAGTEEATESVAKEIKEKEEERIPYTFPPIDLLSKPKRSPDSLTDDDLRETAAKLQQILATFGVNAKVTNVSCGPSVTRYELQLEMGTKVSKITNLADDIKMNLAVTDIRIEAPIPGKAAVGIEVPNKTPSMVYLRELIDSDEFRKVHGKKLSYVVGKDIAGKIVVSDIAKMPHLLIAGATGSGKSVFINTMIMSIIYNADPNEVKMIMIDPKVVELSVYNGIPHLYIPVVTDPKKAAGALNWAVAEMTRRYQEFAEVGVRNLAGYNAKAETLQKASVPGTPSPMPQIVIIVDELADLMMVSGNEVEDAICRLAQLARACGIHLVIATQRPSVDVITGLIKANIPSRIAFAVSSGTDSRTILDRNGAERLLGNGDMLFAPQNYKNPVRIQGAYVSDEEIQEVVDAISQEQNPDKMKERMAEVQKAASSVSSAGDGSEDVDELFAQAGRFIISKDKASIGMLQRWLKIGFNRAARIMDQLSDAGVVGPDEGTKPRKVLMSEEQFENYLEQN